MPQLLSGPVTMERMLRMRRNEVSVGLATFPDSGMLLPEQMGICAREEESGFQMGCLRS